MIAFSLLARWRARLMQVRAGRGRTANEAIYSCGSGRCSPAAGCMQQGPGAEGRSRATRACRTPGRAGRPGRAGPAGTARCARRARRTGTAGSAGRARAQGGFSTGHALGAGGRHGQLRSKRNAGVGILSVRWGAQRGQLHHTSSDWSVPEEALMRRHAVEPAGSFPAGSLFVSTASRSASSLRRRRHRDRRRRTGSRAGLRLLPLRYRCRDRR